MTVGFFLFIGTRFRRSGGHRRFEIALLFDVVLYGNAVNLQRWTILVYTNIFVNRLLSQTTSCRRRRRRQREEFYVSGDYASEAHYSDLEITEINVNYKYVCTDLHTHTYRYVYMYVYTIKREKSCHHHPRTPPPPAVVCASSDGILFICSVATTI